MALIGNVSIGAPASIPTPPAGEVTLFFNTDFSPPRLYYKDETGSIFVYPFSSMQEAEDCCCEIAKNMMDGLTCSVKSGMITLDDYNSFIAQGVTITGARTDDGAGNTTCSMIIMAGNVAVTGLTTSPDTINPLAVAAQSVITATIAPANATNKTVYWSSSNTGVATVSAAGIVTGVAPGVATITGTSADGGFTDTTVVTVV